VDTQKSSIDDTFQSEDLLDWSFLPVLLQFAHSVSTKLLKEIWKEGNNIKSYRSKRVTSVVVIANVTMHCSNIVYFLSSTTIFLSHLQPSFTTISINHVENSSVKTFGPEFTSYHCLQLNRIEMLIDDSKRHLTVRLKS
jgi:hypothetical protein